MIMNNYIKSTFILSLDYKKLKSRTGYLSSPELAQDELLGYRDVRRTCGCP